MSTRVHVPEEVKDKLSDWYSRELLDSVPVLRGSLFGWLFGSFGQHAVTINKTVHLTAHAPGFEGVSGVVLLGHECFHIEQQRDMGWWRFLAHYILSWRPSHIKNGRTHPLEKPAYDRGREIRDALSQ
ncbi:MAG: DUF4157 domain-containing protein [Chloroflexi bacterium]|nr:DUF4157 domain-containing protein [Chloroflexota bacterium]